MKNKQREIKFRAWVEYRKNKYDKELKDFKDKLYKRGERFGIDAYDYSVKSIERFEKEKGVKYEKGFYYEYKMKYDPLIYGSECFGGGGACEVNSEINSGENIFMQFTGLKDKNGKEIYEGDILYKAHTPYGGYENNGGQYKVVEYRLDKYANGYNVRSPLNGDMLWEVIGNIYENPELLEDKNENNTV